MKKGCPFEEVELYNGEKIKLYNYTNKKYKNEYKKDIVQVDYDEKSNNIYIQDHFHYFHQKEINSGEKKLKHKLMFLDEAINKIRIEIKKQKAKEKEFYKNELYFKNIVFDKVIIFPDTIINVYLENSGYKILCDNGSSVFIKDNILTNYREYKTGLNSYVSSRNISLYLNIYKKYNI